MPSFKSALFSCCLVGTSPQRQFAIRSSAMLTCTPCVCGGQYPSGWAPVSVTMSLLLTGKLPTTKSRVSCHPCFEAGSARAMIRPRGGAPSACAALTRLLLDSHLLCDLHWCAVVGYLRHWINRSVSWAAVLDVGCSQAMRSFCCTCGHRSGSVSLSRMSTLVHAGSWQWRCYSPAFDDILSVQACWPTPIFFQSTPSVRTRGSDAI